MWLWRTLFLFLACSCQKNLLLPSDFLCSSLMGPYELIGCSFETLFSVSRGCQGQFHRTKTTWMKNTHIWIHTPMNLCNSQPLLVSLYLLLAVPSFGALCIRSSVVLHYLAMTLLPGNAPILGTCVATVFLSGYLQLKPSFLWDLEKFCVW
jgi:hypothetical protein